MTLTLPISFAPDAAGRAYPIAIQATADDGNTDEFDLAGTVWVGSANVDDEDS